jgi:hypothetical protein
MKQFLVIAALVLGACDAPESGQEYRSGNTPKRTNPEPCGDPTFTIEVDEDGHAVFTPNYCQPLVAACFLSGLDTVTLWCDFNECAETRSITLDSPTVPGAYSISFPNPCGDPVQG